MLFGCFLIIVAVTYSLFLHEHPVEFSLKQRNEQDEEEYYMQNAIYKSNLPASFSFQQIPDAGRERRDLCRDIPFFFLTRLL